MQMRTAISSPLFEDELGNEYQASKQDQDNADGVFRPG
jgi:hypothetical protein